MNRLRTFAKKPMVDGAAGALGPVGEAAGGGSLESCSNLTAASGDFFSSGYCARESLEG